MVQQQLQWVTAALQALAEHLAANHVSPVAATQQLCNAAETITKSGRNFFPGLGAVAGALSWELVSWLWGAGWQRLCLQQPVLIQVCR